MIDINIPVIQSAVMECDGGFSNIEKVDLTSQCKPSEPSLYAVKILNDDYTEADFVTNLLMAVFDRDECDADFITWRIHVLGSYVAGTYAKDVALSKVDQVHQLARSQDFPLRCILQTCAD